VSQRRRMTSKQESARTRTTRDLAIWTAAFVLSLAQWRHTAYFFGNCDASENCDMSDIVRNIRAEVGVLEGYPYWRHFQSRLLGPWAEKSLNVLFGFNFLVAHMIIAIAVLTLCGVVMFYAGRAIGGRQSGWSALLAFQTLFTLMMSRPWLYIWDYFVLLVAAVFLLLVIRRAPWWSFLLLMSVAFFNHESAIFIGVWMAAQALADAWAERRRPDWRMLGGGVLGSLGGILLTEFLRTSLMKRELGWETFRDAGGGPTSQLDAYFHVQIAANFNDIYHWVTQPNFDLLFLIPVPLVMMLALAAILVARHGVKAAGLAVYAVAQVAALLAFGLRAETRDLLQLVPFLCLGGMLAAKSDWDAAGSTGERERHASSFRIALADNIKGST